MKKRDGRARQTARKARKRALSPSEGTDLILAKRFNISPRKVRAIRKAQTPEMSRTDAHAVADRIMGGSAPSGSGVHRETPKDVLYWATRPFGYGEQALDRGQLFRLTGMANDKLLVDLGYVQPAAGEDRFECRVCGAPFRDAGSVESHGRSRHEDRAPSMPPPIREDEESEISYQARLDQWALSAGAAADAQAEVDDRRADQLHPLNLENTAASRS